MTATRRLGAPESKTRVLLLDAAERLLLRDGYAAVTSRRVAAEAGLKPQLIHYYFRTMDDLFLEVFRRRAEANLTRFERTVAEDGSLRALWAMNADPRSAAFNIEFTALANHRKAIRDVIAHYAERFRQLQLDAIAAILEEQGVPPETCPPVVVLLAMTGITQVMAIEAALGVTAGHAEMLEFVNGWLDDAARDLRTAPGVTRLK